MGECLVHSAPWYCVPKAPVCVLTYPTAQRVPRVSGVWVKDFQKAGREECDPWAVLGLELEGQGTGASLAMLRCHQAGRALLPHRMLGGQFVWWEVGWVAVWHIHSQEPMKEVKLVPRERHSPVALVSDGTVP